MIRSDPYLGLLEYIYLIIYPSLAFRLAAMVLSLTGIDTHPTLYPYKPKFLAKDWLTITGRLFLVNNLTA